MAQGIFFFVVGPSGAGKDSLIDGARKQLSDMGRYRFVQRVITRPAGSPGENHIPMTLVEFDNALKKKQFLVSWKAHQLYYGIPIAVCEQLNNGIHVIANGSRSVIRELTKKVERLIVIEITAPTELLLERIIERRRENEDEARVRVERVVEDYPDTVRVISINNNSSLDEGVDKFTQALVSSALTFCARLFPIVTGKQYVAWVAEKCFQTETDNIIPDMQVTLTTDKKTVSARMQKITDCAWLKNTEIGLSEETFHDLAVGENEHVSLSFSAPESRQALKRKIQGEELSEQDYRLLIKDINDGRYSESEVSAFLVTATQHLTDNEVLSLARVRASYANILTWDEPIVVDKHSLGGVPGSRITLIVVPIIAAFGLAMPKTSSRAITSAAGTADAMETLANVSLSVDEVKACVKKARACIAWNGKLNHSRVDDIMNAITRPLGIDSKRWSVASILSKKLAAGSTHIIIDLPWGEQTKLKTQQQAEILADLFISIGEKLGLQVKAFATKGDAPIGSGIGPALEVRDVLAILGNEPSYSVDLCEKALFFAAHILAWDPAVRTYEKGRMIAEDILSSGKALVALQNIIDAQGRHTAILPSPLFKAVKAKISGTIKSIDGWAIAGIARHCGAPVDKSAGISLCCHVGDDVRVGDVLYHLHVSGRNALERAMASAESNTGIVIES